MRDWRDLRVIVRRGPLILEGLDMAGVYGAQQYGVECQPDQGGCGFAATFRRKRRNRAPAWGAFKRHARHCPYVPPARRRQPLRRLAAVVVVVLLLAAVAFLTAANLAGRASSASAPTTTAPTPYEYIPVPAGPPSSSPTGGDR